MDRLVLRREWRLRAARTGAGCQKSAANVPAPGRGLLRKPPMVARLEEAQLHRQWAGHLDSRFGIGPANEGVLGCGLWTGLGPRSRVVAGLTVARLHAEHSHAVQPPVSLLAR